MAQTLEHLARQQQTLASIRSIVRTMKMLAAINAAPYEQAAQAIDHGTLQMGKQRKPRHSRHSTRDRKNSTDSVSS